MFSHSRESGNPEGYDVVTFSCATTPECSPLSCNGLAARVAVNSHCLIASFDEARAHVEQGVFDASEPGPFRIFAVYSVSTGDEFPQWTTATASSR